jgi:hypothetical protein
MLDDNAEFVGVVWWTAVKRPYAAPNSVEE